MDKPKNSELMLTLSRQHLEESKNLRAILHNARTLVATLRDAQREHAAKALEELIFIHDAQTQEANEFLRANSEYLVQAIFDDIKNNPTRGL